MQDFRNLEVWEKSHRLTLAVYAATARFPDEERFGLTNQLRRCSVSIPANIAEGCGRQSDIDFKRFVHIAMGSACELEYLLLLANDLKYFEGGPNAGLSEQVKRVKRMLSSLIAHPRSPAAAPR